MDIPAFRLIAESISEDSLTRHELAVLIEEYLIDMYEAGKIHSLKECTSLMINHYSKSYK